jgi:signal transduction histidine kinase
LLRSSGALELYVEQLDGVTSRVTRGTPRRPVDSGGQGRATAFVNLIANALDAMPRGAADRAPGGRAGTARSGRRRGEPGEGGIEDTGVGIAVDTDRVFNPFYTTRDSGTGPACSRTRSSRTTAGRSASGACRTAGRRLRSSCR